MGGSEVTTFEDILRQVGPLGKWQFWIIFSTGFMQIFAAMNNLANVFTEHKPSFVCDVPGLENITDFDRIRNLSAVKTTGGDFDNCKYYADWNRAESNQGTPVDIRTCTSFRYDTSEMQSTLTTEFNAVCGNAGFWSHGKSAYMGGVFVGSLVAGLCADMFGRKTVFVLTGVGIAIVGSSIALVPNPSTYFFFRFLTGAGKAGYMLPNFVLEQEITLTAHRTLIGGLFFIPYGFALVILSGLAYCIPNWRQLSVTMSAPLFLLIPLWWLLDESPRWLLVHGKKKEAERILRKAASYNNRELPADLHLDSLVLEESPSGGSRKVSFQQNPDSFFKKLCKTIVTKFSRISPVKILSSKILVLRLVNVYFNWFVNAMVYYGLIWSVGDVGFKGNLFVKNLVSGFMEILGYIVCVPLMWFGRKRSLFLMLVVTGVAELVIAVAPGDSSTLHLVLLYLGRVCITASFQIIYVYTSELFPTNVRTQAVGTSSMFARVGSIPVAYIMRDLVNQFKYSPSPVLSRHIHDVIFGVLSLTAAVLCLALPETNKVAIAEDESDAMRNVSWIERRICGFESVDADETPEIIELKESPRASRPSYEGPV